MGFLLGNALSAVVDVHLDIRIWGPQGDKKKRDKAYDTVLSYLMVISCFEEGDSAIHSFDDHLNKVFRDCIINVHTLHVSLPA